MTSDVSSSALMRILDGVVCLPRENPLPLSRARSQQFWAGEAMSPQIRDLDETCTHERCSSSLDCGRRGYGARIPLASVGLRPPIPRPTKLLCGELSVREDGGR